MTRRPFINPLDFLIKERYTEPMKTIEKILPLTTPYDIRTLGAGDAPLFLDIETTGLSPDWSHVYLIGCIEPLPDGQWKITQWLAETPFEERRVLTTADTYVSRYAPLIHFNGNRFDLPFLHRRCEELGLSSCFLSKESVDLYQRIKICKKLCGLANNRQKTMEDFLRISREDRYDGGQLISVYHEYVKTGAEELLKLLLLHNEEDIIGMTRLLTMLNYADLLKGRGPLLAGEPELQKGSGNEAQILAFPLTREVPVQTSFRLEQWYGILKEDMLKLRIPLLAGELRYYLPNYRDYYYLPQEDMAIHKSVAAYVDKDYRLKATKDTCYIKKSGIFLPLPEDIVKDIFQVNLGSTLYGEWKEELLFDTGYWEAYLQALFRRLV